MCKGQWQVRTIPPLRLKKWGSSPLWKSPGQDSCPPSEKVQIRTKCTPSEKFCARSARKNAFLGLSWPENFFRPGLSPLWSENIWCSPPPDITSGQDNYPPSGTRYLAHVWTETEISVVHYNLLWLKYNFLLSGNWKCWKTKKTQKRPRSTSQKN